MSTTLYGACGNQGCLECTPAFIVAFDGGEEQYEANVILERLDA